MHLVGSQPAALWPIRQTALPACHAQQLRVVKPVQAALQGEVLILEDDMEVLRLPKRGLMATAPSDWGALQLYSFGVPLARCCDVHEGS